jgi:hypothetical protein
MPLETRSMFIGAPCESMKQPIHNDDQRTDYFDLVKVVPRDGRRSEAATPSADGA